MRDITIILDLTRSWLCKLVFFLIIVLGMVSCVSPVPPVPPPTYIPPDTSDGKEIENELIVNLPFDQVWSSLIEYSASTFFGIKNFEKDSGLITLQFGSDNPSTFIKCGWVGQLDDKNNGRPIITVMQNYANPMLDGSMNIFVKKINPQKTQIKINARYIFTYSDSSGHFVWSFDTGGYATIWFGRYKVTCKPTYVAEKKILEGVSGLLKNGFTNNVSTNNQ